ncbi:MAG: hypothetical protein J4473_03580 [Candidatus Aenigmarchaeota archaeon]|nr:hypothetical protein [Candidatus Aenigmarchaeota archaeon]
MELVVNSCVVFSVFKAESFTRNLFELLYLKGVKLIVPEYELDELWSLGPRICKYSGLNENEFKIAFILLCEVLDVAPKSEYEKFLPEANKISPHGKQIKDDPYFALAIALNCPIWSDEKAFKQQGRVKVFNSKELSKLVGLEFS